jgi:hypothetical protein
MGYALVDVSDDRVSDLIQTVSVSKDPFGRHRFRAFASETVEAELTFAAAPLLIVECFFEPCGYVPFPRHDIRVVSDVGEESPQRNGAGVAVGLSRIPVIIAPPYQIPRTLKIVDGGILGFD